MLPFLSKLCSRSSMALWGTVSVEVEGQPFGTGRTGSLDDQEHDGQVFSEIPSQCRKVYVAMDLCCVLRVSHMTLTIHLTLVSPSLFICKVVLTPPYISWFYEDQIRLCMWTCFGYFRGQLWCNARASLGSWHTIDTLNKYLVGPCAMPFCAYQGCWHWIMSLAIGLLPD